MLSLVTVSPVITAFRSCYLSHHVFDQVNLWSAWVGIETAIFWQCSPGTVETQCLYPLRHGPQKLPIWGQKVRNKLKKIIFFFLILRLRSLISKWFQLKTNWIMSSFQLLIMTWKLLKYENTFNSSLRESWKRDKLPSYRKNIIRKSCSVLKEKKTVDGPLVWYLYFSLFWDRNPCRNRIICDKLTELWFLDTSADSDINNEIILREIMLVTLKTKISKLISKINLLMKHISFSIFLFLFVLFLTAFGIHTSCINKAVSSNRSGKNEKKYATVSLFITLSFPLPFSFSLSSFTSHSVRLTKKQNMILTAF